MRWLFVWGFREVNFVRRRSTLSSLVLYLILIHFRRGDAQRLLTLCVLNSSFWCTEAVRCKSEFVEFPVSLHTYHTFRRCKGGYYYCLTNVQLQIKVVLV
jgi:hypothetical protein